MKKILFLLLIVSNSLFAQNAKVEAEAIKTKMDAFTSKTGSIIRFIDYKLPELKTQYSAPETRIRRVNAGNTTSYFYQIKKTTKYGEVTASIEYSDLLEIIKAVNIQKAEFDKDVSGSHDYLENRFITIDGFQVGYYVDKGKGAWYLTLEKYGTDKTLFINDSEIIMQAFNEAKLKIEELKKQ
ncbi:hypothetical protein GCM10027275_16580 [Rhabdobacter roseus]|uniref:Uncharacterized protein n=1 Tax=Rhabdobacter roseus TaxID=1655419 RepID=A0A840TV80_9BACT|nr:hypothetical protein [Rhabdobacter roseus]MBB5283579.1 hypothetical protein [Rhabdobacter roseus]